MVLLCNRTELIKEILGKTHGSGRVGVFSSLLISNIVLTSHRFWLMTDIDYNSWPGMLRESLLLRNENKVKFNAGSGEGGERPHLPELREEREQKEAVFRRLLATGRDGVVIARSLTDSSKDPVGESQFVTSIFAEKEARRCWRSVGELRYPLEESLKSVRLTDSLRKEWGVRYPSDV